MLHSMYIQKRKEGVQKEDFTKDWRDHFELARSIPDFWAPIGRYVQNDVLESLPGVDEVAVGYDAVGEIFFKSAEARAAVPPEARQPLFLDSQRFFGMTSRGFLGEQRVLSPEPAQPYKVLRFVAAKADVGADKVAKAIQDSELFTSGAKVALDVAGEGSAFASVLSVWVESPEAARTLLLSKAWKDLSSALAPLAEDKDSLTLVARETVLQQG